MITIYIHERDRSYVDSRGGGGGHWPSIDWLASLYK